MTHRRCLSSGKYSGAGKGCKTAVGPPARPGKWRAIMRRRNTPNTVLRAVPHPVDPEADVLALYDARQKLQTAIATETQKGETAETDFVRNLAREISYGKVVNVESVFQRNEAAKTAADRAKDRIYAL